MNSASIWAFLAAFRNHWFAAMSGGLSVPLTIVSAFAGQTWQQLGLIILAIACGGFAAFRIWQVQRVQVVALEARLRPIIQVFLDPENEGVRPVFTDIWEDWGIRAGPGSRWVQVMIRSASDAPLNDCEVRALSFEALDGEHFKVSEPVHCGWSNTTEVKIDIPSGVAMPANLLSFDFHANRLLIQLVPAKAGLNSRIQNPNTFQFMLAVSAKDAVTVLKLVNVKWDGEPDNIKVQLADA